MNKKIPHHQNRSKPDTLGIERAAHSKHARHMPPMPESMEPTPEMPDNDGDEGQTINRMPMPMRRRGGTSDAGGGY